MKLSGWFVARVMGESVTPMEYFETVVARYPGRLNTALAQYGVLALLS